MDITPSHLKYTKTHEWVDTKAKEAVIGITFHAQELLGDLVFIEFPEVGQVVAAGDELGVLESVKAASDYYAPVGGVVTAINEALVANPALINQDPYGEAWLVKLLPQDNAEAEGLLSAEQYSQCLTDA